jgi:hypothetical protein
MGVPRRTVEHLAQKSAPHLCQRAPILDRSSCGDPYRATLPTAFGRISPGGTAPTTSHEEDHMAMPYMAMTPAETLVSPAPAC